MKDELLHGEKKIGVWGLGYIGFSTITYFARAGVYCIGTDVKKHRIDDVNNGKATIPNLDFWLGFDTVPLAKNGLMRATLDWKELITSDVAVHMITIPTEMWGKPYHNILKDVIKKLCLFKDLDVCPLIIVESTLTPTVVDNVVVPLFKENGLRVGKDILLGIAPRRDWFTSGNKTLKTIPRIVGGTNQKTSDLMADVLGIICDNVLKAKDHKHAAIVKSIENAYRQLDIAFANQLSLAYPDMDMRTVLKLVGTKWNIGTFYPSIGSGGYCIPLAPQYVLEGAKHPEKLTLINESLKTDFGQPAVVVKSILDRGAKDIAILGIAYLGDLKVHTMSPALSIIKKLKDHASVKVHDPYYSDEELKKLTGCEVLDFPDLNSFDTILICAGHSQYKYTNTGKILNNLKNCKLIIDNNGIWRDIDFPSHIEYHEAGDANWLGS